MVQFCENVEEIYFYEQIEEETFVPNCATIDDGRASLSTDRDIVVGLSEFLE